MALEMLVRERPNQYIHHDQLFKQLMEEIKQLDNEETEQIFKLPNSWREKGLKEGKIEGKMEEKRQIALEMLKEDLSVELVSKITKLTRDEIEELKKKI
jgi:predicted transposase YdaD